MTQSIYQLAVQALAEARFDEASGLFSEASRLNPDDPRIYLGLGASYCQAGEINLALGAFQQAIMLQPDNPDIAFAIASTLQNSGQNRLAEGVYRNILNACPEHLPASHNLATLLYAEEQFQAAIEQHQSTLEYHPAALSSRRDLGQALIAAGHVNAGIAQLESALQMSLADTADSVREEVRLCRFSLGLAYLRQQNWQQGWPLYEYRWHPAEWQEITETWGRSWEGSALHGKKLLVLAEQGYGDCLMFGRYLSDLAEEAAALEILLPQPLTALFQNAFWNKPNVLITSRRTTDPHDYFVKMGSLPLRCHAAERRNIHLAPPPPLQLRTDSSRPSHGGLFHLSPQQTDKPRCGIVWRGQKNFAADNRRSLTLESLLSVLPFGNVNFASLQIDASPSEKELLGNYGIVDCTDAISDFQDTANLISQLDAVITVDTAMAHLTGSMGKPLLLLQRQEGEWRWGSESDKNPWYERCFSIRINQGKPDANTKEIVTLLDQLIANPSVNHKSRIET